MMELEDNFQKVNKDTHPARVKHAKGAVSRVVINGECDLQTKNKGILQSLISK